MTGTQFSIDPSDGGFYVIVGATVTVYQQYADALAAIQPTLADDTDAFLAEISIEPTGEEDVSVTLEQVSWQRVVRDLTTEQATAETDDPDTHAPAETDQ